uniref:PHD-type domain-containing protein n=2 Tax=Amphimedon queenslandica TaxID=400682 RepID=A0A1X7SHM8_AMPQE
MCARKKDCRFLSNKEVYCQQHSSLPVTSDTVKDEDMRVDRCIIIHTDNDRPGRKFTKSFPPQNIQLRIGSLLIRSAGSLSPLSDTISPSLLIPHSFSSSSLFWSLTTPTQRITYTLTVSADLPKEEPLPLTTPTPETPPTSPGDLRWPCVSTQVSSDPDNEGVWSAVSSKSQILSSPSLINNSVTDKSNPEIALRIFRIPKKTRSSSSSPPPTLAIGLTITAPLPVTSVHCPQSHREEETVRPVLPLDSPALNQWETGSPPHSVNSVHYELSNEEGQSWRGPDLKGSDTNNDNNDDNNNMYMYMLVLLFGRSY